MTPTKKETHGFKSTLYSNPNLEKKNAKNDGFQYIDMTPTKNDTYGFEITLNSNPNSKKEKVNKGQYQYVDMYFCIT